MKIKWFGQSCFRITSEDGTKIILDPYKMPGYKLPELQADMVTVSHNHSDHNNVDAVGGNFILIKGPRMFSQNGIEITGVQTFHDDISGARRGNNIVYNFKINGIYICHCGDLGHLLSLEQINKIGIVDILMLPVGGGTTLDVNGAVEVVKQLNPKIVIPMHYRTEAMGALGFVFEKVDSFIMASKKSVKSYEELYVDLSNIKDFPEIAILQYD